MAKFCGKCGNPLNDYGYCPNCNPVQDNAGQWAQPECFNQSPVYEPGPARVSYPPQKPKLTKKEKKALKKKKKKQKKAEKRAKLSTSQKIKRFFLKLIAVILALAIVAGSVTCALVYKGKISVPFIEKIISFFGAKKDNSTQNMDDESNLQEEQIDEELNTPYHVDPPDADSFFKNNTTIVSVVKANESQTVHTEAEAYRNLTERGFTQFSISSEYTMNGEYSITERISDTVTLRHPIYQTYYKSDSNELWRIYEVNGYVIAEPLSYIENSNLSVPIMISEKNTLTSYDGTTNTFYETIPKETTIVVKTVERIDATTLNYLTGEVIAGL